MAISTHKGQRPHQVNRTPAPDEVTHIRSPRGGDTYGQNTPQPSSLAPGKGGPQSLLGQNLRDSVDDPAMDQVLKSGTAGRDDSIPADGEDFQTRSVSDQSYPVAAGGSMVRQQNPDKIFGKATLPASTTDGEEEPVRKPGA